MLVLSRKARQQLVIGENVRITVLGIQGNTIRLGIEAPDDVRIMRSELVSSTKASQGRPPAHRAMGKSQQQDGRELTLQIDSQNVTTQQRSGMAESRAVPVKLPPLALHEPAPGGLGAWVDAVRST